MEPVTDLETLVQIIKLLPDTEHTSVVGLSGFAGSGKSSMAAQLCARIDNCAVVSTDDFMVEGYEQRSSEWSCIDRKRITHDIIQAAEAGVHIRYLAYDWSIQQLGQLKELGMPQYLILEGIGIMHPDLMPYFDLTIWIDCPLEEAVQRGMKRDREVLGANNDTLWQTVWKLNDAEFYAKYRPDQKVDCLFVAPESTVS